MSKEDFQPLTEKEKQFLIDNGWEFAGDDYIFIPDDYDGCMANGIPNIRRVLQGLERAKEFID